MHQNVTFSNYKHQKPFMFPVWITPSVFFKYLNIATKFHFIMFISVFLIIKLCETVQEKMCLITDEELRHVFIFLEVISRQQSSHQTNQVSWSTLRCLNVVIALTGYQDSKNIELKYICFDRYISKLKWLMALCLLKLTLI